MHPFQTTPTKPRPGIAAGAATAAAVALSVLAAVLLIAWQPAGAPSEVDFTFESEQSGITLSLAGGKTQAFAVGETHRLPVGTYQLQFTHSKATYTQKGLDFKRLLKAYPGATHVTLKASVTGKQLRFHATATQNGAVYTLITQVLSQDGEENARKDEENLTGTDEFGFGDEADAYGDDYGFGQPVEQAPHNGRPHSAAKRKATVGGMATTYGPPRDRQPRLPDSGGEEFGKIQPNVFTAAQQKPLSTFSIDVDRASYAFMRRYILNGSLPPADAVRIEELINYFPYTYQRPEKNAEHPFAVNTEVATCPWAPTHQLVRIGIAGQDVETENLPASNLVFLLDVSGSMSSDDKLPLLKSALGLMLPKLRPQDRIAIVVYAGAAGLVLPSTSAADSKTILAALEQLEAGGSTAGGAGIELAYKVAQQNFIEGGNNRVILCTDGDFNVGTSSESGLESLIEKKRASGVFLTVLGFGRGNTKDNFMELLADKGNGNYAYIDNLLEARKTLVEELGGTLLTIAKDVKLQIEFNPATVKGYRLIGYENRLLRDEDFADDTKDAGELGAGHTVTALYEIIPAGSKEEIPGASELKYQKPPAGAGSELLTVSLRYKAPAGDTSKLLSYAVKNSEQSWERAGQEFRFAAGVAAFAMTLRRDELRGASTYTLAQELLANARGSDAQGYRNELLRLVGLAQSLDQRAEN